MHSTFGLDISLSTCSCSKNYLRLTTVELVHQWIQSGKKKNPTNLVEEQIIQFFSHNPGNCDDICFKQSQQRSFQFILLQGVTNFCTELTSPLIWQTYVWEHRDRDLVMICRSVANCWRHTSWRINTIPANSLFVQHPISRAFATILPRWQTCVVRWLQVITELLKVWNTRVLFHKLRQRGDGDLRWALWKEIWVYS